MINKEGKATTVFLLVLAILSLCLTAGTLVLFRQEKDKRLSLEQQLEQLGTTKLQTDKKLEETKKQSFLLEEKLKESDTKLSNLATELEVEKSFREQLASENKDLKDAIVQESKAKEELTKKFSRSVGELKALRNKVRSLSMESLALEEKIKAASGEVSLDKIVVSPATNNEGNVVVVNKEHDFAVINMGEANGITVDQILSISRNKKHLGEVKVERVQNNLSVVDFIAPLNKDKVKEGDRVVLKK